MCPVEYLGHSHVKKSFEVYLKFNFSLRVLSGNWKESMIVNVLWFTQSKASLVFYTLHGAYGTLPHVSGS